MNELLMILAFLKAGQSSDPQSKAPVTQAVSDIIARNNELTAHTQQNMARLDSNVQELTNYAMRLSSSMELLVWVMLGMGILLLFSFGLIVIYGRKINKLSDELVVFMAIMKDRRSLQRDG